MLVLYKNGAILAFLLGRYRVARKVFFRKEYFSGNSNARERNGSYPVLRVIARTKNSHPHPGFGVSEERTMSIYTDSFNVETAKFVEHMEEIDTEMLLYGTDCGHNPGNNLAWWRILTDGEVTVTREAPRCEHGPQYHIGCPEGTADARVVGGTYAIQWRNLFQPRRIVVTPEADLDWVEMCIHIQHELWDMEQHPAQFWRPEDTEALLRLAVLQATRKAVMMTFGQKKKLERLIEEHRNVVPRFVVKAILDDCSLSESDMEAAEAFRASRTEAFKQGGVILAKWMCQNLPIYRSGEDLYLGNSRDANRIEKSNPETLSRWWVPNMLDEYRNDVKQGMLLQHAKELGTPVSLVEKFGDSRGRMCYEAGGVAFDCCWGADASLYPCPGYSEDPGRAKGVQYLYCIDWGMDCPDIWILN